MTYHWRDIPVIFRSPFGRMQALYDFFQRSWPVLSRIAKLHRQTIGKKTRVVAVVGSFGKSTTTRSVTASLGGQIQKVSQRNAGSFVARAVLRIRPFDRHTVMEVGIDRPGVMAGYASMIRPDITVVTSIGSEHHRSLGTLDVTRAEKSEMVRILPETGLAVLNGDDPNVLWMADQTCARVITYGFNDTNDIQANNINIDWPKGTRFTLHLNGRSHNMNVRLIGRHMLYTILAAVAVAVGEGFSIDQLLPSLETLPPTPGRMEPVKLASGAVILRDDYKSALETIEVALDAFSEIPAKRRIIVFGDVSEPQGSQGPIYRRLGKRIASIASCVYLLTDKKCFERYRSGLLKGGFQRSSIVHVQENLPKAIGILHDDLGPDDVVLIKGRDTQRLERIAFSLMGKNIECWINYCGIKLTRCEHCPRL